MIRPEIKRLISILQAYLEGKTIQYKKRGTDQWFDNKELGLDIYEYYDYRVKPESKYRPFKDKEECWQEMQKHHPFGWVIDKLENFQHLALVYSCDSNSCDSDNGDRVGLSVAAVSIDFENMLKDFKFADGTPFGIKEE